MIAALLAGTALLSQPEPAAGGCRPQGALQTVLPADPALLFRERDRRAVRFTRLGDLPRANHEVAVLRSIGGCSAPLVVRYNVGP